jgi:hypothetical protein
MACYPVWWPSICQSEMIRSRGAGRPMMKCREDLAMPPVPFTVRRPSDRVLSVPPSYRAFKRPTTSVILAPECPQERPPER